MLVELSIGLSLGTSEEEVNIVYVSLGKRVLKQSLGFIGKTGTELSTVQYRILLGVCVGGDVCCGSTRVRLLVLTWDKVSCKVDEV